MKDEPFEAGQDQSLQVEAEDTNSADELIQEIAAGPPEEFSKPCCRPY